MGKRPQDVYKRQELPLQFSAVPHAKTTVKARVALESTGESVVPWTECTVLDSENSVSYTHLYLTQMIGGQMDVETAWPNYVAEYEAAGAAELETMVNEDVYKRQVPLSLGSCHTAHLRKALVFPSLRTASATICR